LSLLFLFLVNGQRQPSASLQASSLAVEFQI
jgi:hypothetical protein